MTRELEVHEGAATERLDVFLAHTTGATRSHAQRLIRSGAVKVNGTAEKPSYPVEPGDIVHINETAPPPAARPALELPVMYEDADILVVDKPAGLATHPGSGTGTEPTIVDFARLHSSDPDPERPGIVHRLDRDTSGLLIIAKTPAAKAYLQQQFQSRQVRKAYTVLTVGRLSPTGAVIRLPIGRDPAHPLRRAVVPGGREAITRYRTVVAYPGYTLAEAEPETGRTHQIRVHLAATGHPVAGDTTYGQPRRPLGLARHFLHASRLEFTAPSGRHVSLESPLPPDLKRVVQILEEKV